MTTQLIISCPGFLESLETVKHITLAREYGDEQPNVELSLASQCKSASFSLTKPGRLILHCFIGGVGGVLHLISTPTPLMLNNVSVGISAVQEKKHLSNHKTFFTFLHGHHYHDRGVESPLARAQLYPHECFPTVACVTCCAHATIKSNMFDTSVSRGLAACAMWDNLITAVI